MEEEKNSTPDVRDQERCKRLLNENYDEGIQIEFTYEADQENFEKLD